MEIKLDRRFRKNLEGRFGKFQFEVGILEDKPHKNPVTGNEARKNAWKKNSSLRVNEATKAGTLSSYAGGPIRKKSRKAGPLTISEVSAANRERLGFNYLSEAFSKKTSEVVKFTNEFFRLAFGKSQKKRAENLLQAVVRNPILRGDYGKNSARTAKAKGFDRHMIDTAQLFKAIKAICRVKSGV